MDRHIRDNRKVISNSVKTKYHRKHLNIPRNIQVRKQLQLMQMKII